MDDTLLTTIAERFGTPVFAYDLDAVSRQVARHRSALPAAELLYAVKANPNGALLRHLAALEVGAEAITLGELERAARAGFSPQRLLLGGPRQDPPLIARAAELSVGLVGLDGSAQWADWRRSPPSDTRFVVRVNPALDPRTHAHLATGAADSKFGLPAAEAAALAADVAATGQLAGFHVHAGSQISDLRVYDEIFVTLAPLYERFPGGILDLGGGFAVPGFELELFATKVRAFAQPHGLQVVLEPGRQLVSEAGVLLTRILRVREGPVRHLIADASMAELIRPALYDAVHPIRPLLPKAISEARPADVDGPLCENADRLGRGVLLPEVEAGTLLAVSRTGAYGFTMASNYASSLRPAEVVVEGGEPRLARRREHLEDLWGLEPA